MITITGDVHGRFDALNRIYEKNNTEFGIVCGDFGYFPNIYDFKKEAQNLTSFDKLYWCDGNHENHDILKSLEDKEVQKNIFYQPRGTVRNIMGWNFMFFGGANSIDKHLRTPGYDWFAGEDISNKDLDNLPDVRVDVMITHTCPMEVTMPQHYEMDRLTDNNRKYLSNLYDKYKPKFWFFGHWHTTIQQQYKNTTFVGLNMLPENGCFLNFIDFYHWYNKNFDRVVKGDFSDYFTLSRGNPYSRVESRSKGRF